MHILNTFISQLPYLTTIIINTTHHQSHQNGQTIAPIDEWYPLIDTC